jgi:hypothetical protein
MADRLTSHILIQALIRKTEAEGGFAMVLHKGDRISGAILVQIAGRGEEPRLFERISDFSGGYALMPVATQYSGHPEMLAQYIERRCKSDPDLWLIELDVVNAERFAAALLTQC